MRACWAVTLLVLVQPSLASCATCRGTSVVPRVLAPTHRHLRKSPSVRRPFAEISGSISFSSLWFPFPETVSNFVCHFKGSLHLFQRISAEGERSKIGKKQILRLQPQFRPLAWRSNINYTGFRNGRLHPNRLAFGTGRKIMQLYRDSREVESCESQSLPFELSTCPDFPSW